MTECNNESIPEGTLPLTSGFNIQKKRSFSSIQGKYLPTIVAHNCQESFFDWCLMLFDKPTVIMK